MLAVTPVNVSAPHLKGKPMKLGDLVRKIRGLPFGGGKCPHCNGDLPLAQINGFIDDGRRVSAKHPEGWSHIFDPEQLEVIHAD